RIVQAPSPPGLSYFARPQGGVRVRRFSRGNMSSAISPASRGRRRDGERPRYTPYGSAPPQRTASSRAASRYEVLSQGLSNGVSAIAGAELGVGFLQVAANCPLAKPQFPGNPTKLPPRRNQAQDSQFPRRQATV